MHQTDGEGTTYIVGAVTAGEADIYENSTRKVSLTTSIQTSLDRLRELTGVAQEGWYKEAELEFSKTKSKRLGPSRFERWLRKKVRQYDSGHRPIRARPKKKQRR